MRACLGFRRIAERVIRIPWPGLDERRGGRIARWGDDGAARRPAGFRCAQPGLRDYAPAHPANRRTAGTSEAKSAHP